MADTTTDNTPIDFGLDLYDPSTDTSSTNTNSSGSLISPAAQSNGWLGFFNNLVANGTSAFTQQQKTAAATTTANAQTLTARLQAAASSSTGKLVIIGLVLLVVAVIAIPLLRGKKG